MTDTFWLFNQLGGVVVGLALCALGAAIILLICRAVWCLVWEIPVELLRFKIIPWIRCFPNKLRECLTYRHCPIKGCKGSHTSHA